MLKCINFVDLINKIDIIIDKPITKKEALQDYIRIKVLIAEIRKVKFAIYYDFFEYGVIKSDEYFWDSDSAKLYLDSLGITPNIETQLDGLIVKVYITEDNLPNKPGSKIPIKVWAPFSVTLFLRLHLFCAFSLLPFLCIINC